ncbi:glycosidase [Sesbania bispinosa]|nr:glycosidase [Sesbania bispinosa]
MLIRTGPDQPVRPIGPITGDRTVLQSLKTGGEKNRPENRKNRPRTSEPVVQRFGAVQSFYEKMTAQPYEIFSSPASAPLYWTGPLLLLHSAQN